jgi:hypothetical protein
MTTLLDIKRSATSHVFHPDAAALDQVPLSIATPAPVVARRVPRRRQGTWSEQFASGRQNPEWIATTCLMTVGGFAIPASHAPSPMTRTCLLLP